MGIYKSSITIKDEAIRLQGINMASFGDIKLYDNKKSIQYPYVNIDVINSKTVNNAAKFHTVRIYICDRNVPYIAYNKCDLLLDELMLLLEISNYTTNYFNLDFKDQVNGVYTDIVFESDVNLKCVTDDLSNVTWITDENGNYHK